MAYQVIEVWAVVDSEGNVEVGTDAEQASERYKNLDVDELYAIRFLKLALKVEVADPIVITANLPAKIGAVEMSVTG